MKKKELTKEQKAEKLEKNKDLNDYFNSHYGNERFHSKFHNGKDGNWTNQVNMKGRDIPPIYFTLREREEELIRLRKINNLLINNAEEKGGLEFIKNLEESKLKKENEQLKEQNRHLKSLFNMLEINLEKQKEICELVKEK